jgi:hypothetical protein
MADPGDRRRRRRFRRGPTLGPIRVSWRWEVGMPLVLIGFGIAALTVSTEGLGLVFWVGAALTAVGTAVMLQA